MNLYLPLKLLKYRYNYDFKGTTNTFKQALTEMSSGCDTEDVRKSRKSKKN